MGYVNGHTRKSPSNISQRASASSEGLDVKWCRGRATSERVTQIRESYADSSKHQYLRYEALEINHSGQRKSNRADTRVKSPDGILEGQWTTEPVIFQAPRFRESGNPNGLSSTLQQGQVNTKQLLKEIKETIIAKM